MRDASLDCDRAHEVCSTVEFVLRMNGPVKLFRAPGQRKIRKTDLPRLTSQELFEHFLKHHVKVDGGAVRRPVGERA